MKMDRMMFHRTQIPKSDSNAVAVLGYQSRGTRERPTVKCEDIEVGHFNRDGTPGAHIDPPLARHQGEVSIYLQTGRSSRMNDKHPHHPKGYLGHVVGVRVVHVCSVLSKLKLVFIGFAGRDIFLAEPRHPIHARCDQQAVPVNAGVFTKPIRHVDA